MGSWIVEISRVQISAESLSWIFVDNVAMSSMVIFGEIAIIEGEIAVQSDSCCRVDVIHPGNINFSISGDIEHRAWTAANSPSIRTIFLLPSTNIAAIEKLSELA